MRAFAESRGEDVWLRESGMLRVSAAPAQDAGIVRAVEAAAAVGRPDQAVALSRDDLARRVSSPVFREGVFFPDGATVHPGLLVRALRRAAIDAGVELYEGTPVKRVRDGVLEAEGGSVRAREIVLAMNAALTGWSPASRSLTNFGSYVVLTEPAPELIEEIGWTGGEAIVDARMFLHYFRTTADGRVLMGSGSGPIGSGGRVDGRFSGDRPTAARAEAGLRRLLPGLAGARVERAWGGPIDVSADHLPFFATKPGTRIHYGAGYSGHGAGPSWLGGRILASLALGADDEWTRLPLAARHRSPAPPGAAPPHRRRARAGVDHGVRGGGGAGTAAAARSPCGSGASAPARHGARDALERYADACVSRVPVPAAIERAMSSVEMTPTGRFDPGSVTARCEIPCSAISCAAVASGSVEQTVTSGVTALPPAVRVSTSSRPAATRSRSETTPQSCMSSSSSC